MKILSIAILRYNGDTEEPIMLHSAQDLSSFGYFQRSTVKEFLIFATRTVLKRTPQGKRQSVLYEENLCHCYLRSDGLGAVLVADNEYPQRVAFTLISQSLDEFTQKYANQWQNVKVDTPMSLPSLDKAIVEYQDPSKADKITKIQKDLDDTMDVMSKTIDSVLERGVKLDSLVEKSGDLQDRSKLFYKTAKSHNSCCIIC